SRTNEVRQQIRRILLGASLREPGTGRFEHLSGSARRIIRRMRQRRLVPKVTREAPHEDRNTSLAEAAQNRSHVALKLLHPSFIIPAAQLYRFISRNGLHEGGHRNIIRASGIASSCTCHPSNACNDIANSLHHSQPLQCERCPHEYRDPPTTCS